MLNLKKYKHFSFDVWLTLIKSHPEFKLKRTQLFKDYFEINTKKEDLFKIIKYYDDTCNSINELTGGNIDTFEIYLLILSRFDLKPQKEELEKFYTESEKLFFQYPPILLDHFTKNHFEEIKHNGGTANILSNTGFINGKTIRKYFENNDYLNYFDFEIFSDEVNLSKPNKEIFRLVDERIDVKINRKLIVHIGDNYKSDYLGATNYGFDAYLIENEKDLQPK